MFVGIGVGIGRQRFAGGFADSYSARVLADGGTIESLSCVANASTLLQQASFLFIPSGYKAGVAYSALPNNSNGDLTWTRNSTANRTNSSGLIESVGTNVPRLSYMYGSCPSALLEPQRTNLCLYSQNFADSSWVTLNSTRVSTTQTDPSGFSTALNVTWTSGGSKYFYRTQSGLTVGTTYTLSFYVKSSNSSKFRIYSESLGFTTSNLTSTTDFARYTLTFTATVTSGTIGLQSASDNTSADLIVAFAQLEAGSYATTYIPTTTATATRINDAFSRTNIYTNGLIGASGGTWYAEFKNNMAYLRDNASSAIFINTGTSPSINDGFRLRNNGSSRIAIDKVVSSINTGLFVTTTDNVKIAIKWNGSTADVFQNGVKVVSATAFTTTAMEFMNGGPQMPIFIQTMALFNTPLSDTDCITLTT